MLLLLLLGHFSCVLTIILWTSWCKHSLEGFIYTTILCSQKSSVKDDYSCQLNFSNRWIVTLDRLTVMFKREIGRHLGIQVQQVSQVFQILHSSSYLHDIFSHLFLIENIWIYQRYGRNYCRVLREFPRCSTF